jgi:16S rRNA A1518/A1519 N6-dimethyltransferase RsmA/KsgA/DIM1 with predicted DNA glycosylase/AP lyase activity
MRVLPHMMNPPQHASPAAGSTSDPLQLGQHFLRDESVISALVASASLSSSDLVLEVGFGRGSITKELAKICKVIATEVDETLTLDIPGVEVVHENALDLIKLRPCTAMVSNPPFTLLEPLMRRLLPRRELTRVSLVMPQSFADLLQGRTKLGVLSQAIYAIKIVMDVPAAAFYPAPDTRCVIVAMHRRAEDVKNQREKILTELVMQHDKKLKNSLEKAYQGILTKREVKSRFGDLGEILDKGILGISEEQFGRLYPIIS